jgi:hypothetical protein
MSINLDLRENPFDEPVLSDDEGRALQTHDALSIHGLFLIDAIFGCHTLFGVGQKRHVQLMFVSKSGLFFHAIRACPNHHCAPFFDLGLGIAELGCLARSAGRVGFGIEEENHNLFSSVIAQFQSVSMIILENKVRRFVAFSHHRILRIRISNASKIIAVGGPGSAFEAFEFSSEHF